MKLNNRNEGEKELEHFAAIDKTSLHKYDF